MRGCIGIPVLWNSISLQQGYQPLVNLKTISKNQLIFILSVNVQERQWLALKSMAMGQLQNCTCIVRKPAELGLTRVCCGVRASLGFF